MKYIVTIITFIVVCLILIDCMPQQKITYDIPESVNQNDRQRMIIELEKGKELYKLNCAKCHTVKRTIPDFTREQIANYNLRALNPEHAKNINRENLRAEDLDRILGFLMYKQKKVKK